VNIRPAVAGDFDAMWEIFRAVVAGGDTYPFAPGTPRADAHAYWLAPNAATWVIEADGKVVGMYKLVANQPGLGSHIANASFMVDPAFGGKGAGKAMGLHCLEEARRRGYRAMQFNFVVSTNTRAVALWRSLGFAIVGTLPGAFMHKELGYVDAYVMYRPLEPFPMS
jgi:ribosomal protein S18 acetylase RimI-like enzyme